MTIIDQSTWRWGQEEYDVRVTREQLYELLWSAPMRILAPELGLSDVGLAKLMRHRGIPLPERGYWAKLHAGKVAQRVPLPPRQPGQARLLSVTGKLAGRFAGGPHPEENPDGPFASASVPESLEELRRVILEQIGKVVVPAKLDRLHRALHPLLRKDERRREKIASSRWPNSEWAPVFDTPDQQHKLRIANALMMTLARQGYESQLYGEELGFRTLVGDTYVQVLVHRLGEQTADRYHGAPPPSRSQVPLQVKILERLPDGFPRSWDDGTPKLETRIAEIASSIICAGEARYRLSIRGRLDRIAAERERREQRRREEEAKRNAERLKALRTSAEMLRQANDLRDLIMSVRQAMVSGPKQIDPEQLAAWERWAHAEADRLDPVLSGQIDEHLR